MSAFSSAANQWMWYLVVLSCLAFTIATPPFEVPDEPQHFSRAVELAEGHVLAERRGAAIGRDIERRFADLSQVEFPRAALGVPTHYGADAFTSALASNPNGHERVFVEYANVAGYAPTLYVPQAIGILIGRMFGLPGLYCFYLARLFNLGAFLALLWAALRIIPFGQPVLLAVAVLPTSTFQAASVSPDATINGLGWLAIALSLAAGNGVVGSVRHGRWLAMAAVPLGLCKGLYAPLVLAGALRRSWGWPLLAMIAAVGAFLAWTAIAGGDQPVYLIQDRLTGRLVSTVPLREQLAVIVADPLRYLHVLGSSITERSPVYALQLVGRFGWNAILLPGASYLLAVGMLISSMLSTKAAASLWQRVWWFGLAFGLVLLVETALYLTGTPKGASFVQGTQGRYFLPIMPLALLALSQRNTPTGTLHRVNSNRFRIGAALTLQLVALLTAIDAFWLHGFTAVQGLPPISHSVDGILRVLLLPSPRW